jgi:hypothetical protein
MMHSLLILRGILLQAGFELRRTQIRINAQRQNRQPRRRVRTLGFGLGDPKWLRLGRLFTNYT